MLKRCRQPTCHTPSHDAMDGEGLADEVADVVGAEPLDANVSEGLSDAVPELDGSALRDTDVEPVALADALEAGRAQASSRRPRRVWTERMKAGDLYNSSPRPSGHTGWHRSLPPPAPDAAPFLRLQAPVEPQRPSPYYHHSHKHTLLASHGTHILT
jgi:hypothetical protein